MATSKHIQNELEALHGALKAPSGASQPQRKPQEPAGDSEESSELSRVLHDLQSNLTGLMQNTEEAIAAHPAASVGSAFLLGFALGRLSRGKS